jgi:hypothetical protein
MTDVLIKSRILVTERHMCRGTTQGEDHVRWRIKVTHL